MPASRRTVLAQSVIGSAALAAATVPGTTSALGVRPAPHPIPAATSHIDQADIAVDGRFHPGLPTAPHRACRRGRFADRGQHCGRSRLARHLIPEGVGDPFRGSLGDAGPGAPAWPADAQTSEAIAVPLGLLPRRGAECAAYPTRSYRWICIRPLRAANSPSPRVCGFAARLPQC
ncbi:hypothetical protein OH799_27700 [Nocardia sp. NBC_00881]|uniref:hypothetical protein n=1 Tax=Nocardia sp. NBC_00881 TaxID=2975995 RepID=UPI003863D1D4|nr:hypothetical protein OH799_27700 [Nocardia sp. NBC_00881]